MGKFHKVHRQIRNWIKTSAQWLLINSTMIALSYQVMVFISDYLGTLKCSICDFAAMQ